MHTHAKVCVYGESQGRRKVERSENVEVQKHLDAALVGKRRMSEVRRLVPRNSVLTGRAKISERDW